MIAFSISLAVQHSKSKSPFYVNLSYTWNEEFFEMKIFLIQEKIQKQDMGWNIKYFFVPWSFKCM